MAIFEERKLPVSASVEQVRDNKEHRSIYSFLIFFSRVELRNWHVCRRKDAQNYC